MMSRKLRSTIDNANIRSGYGDMYAHRDADMMAAHVVHLRSHNRIDETMAVELLKPSKDIAYSTEYLESHPEYKGVQPGMLSFTTAERHQRKRDKEMLKFIEDFEAGRIDEWGNPVTQEAAVVVTMTESGSDSSRLTDLVGAETQVEASAGSPTATLPLQSRSSSPTTAPAPVSQLLPTQAPASAPSLPKPSQKRKSKSETVPLKPGPGARDYAGYKYGQLVAECRRRKILHGGDTQTVRNRLIQDDVNVKQGLPRELMTYQGKDRNYKHEAPAELTDSVEKGST